MITWSDTLKIDKYPQYRLYKFTKLLNINKEKFQKPYTGKRAVNGTIVNRTYYSAYSYALLWLEEHEFKPKKKWEFEVEGEEYKTEHQQVRDALDELNYHKTSRKLFQLHELRKRADYKMFNPLTDEDVADSIKYMNEIFDELKLKKL